MSDINPAESAIDPPCACPGFKLMGGRGGSKVWLRMRGLRPPPEKVAVPHFPDLWKRLDGHKLVPVNLTGDEEKKATADFNSIFRPR